MIKRRRHNLDVWPGRQNVAGRKVVELDLALRRFDLNRKQRIAHQLSNCFLHPARGSQIAGPEAKPVSSYKRRHKERQANQMIDMAVAQKQIDVDRPGFFRQRKTQHTQPGSGVEYKAMITALHLDA
jgi:hypothetical protein